MTDIAERRSTLQKQRDLLFATDHLNSTLRSRSVRGGVVTLTSQALKFFLMLGSTVIMARLLTPEDYGLVGMVMVVTGFVAIFKDLGLGLATIQRNQIDHAQISTLFWANFAISALVTLVTVALAAPIVSWFYDDGRLSSVTRFFALGFMFGGLAVQHEALLRRQMRFGALAMIDIGSLLAAIAVGIACAWYGLGYWALVINQLTFGIAHTIGVWVACRWCPGRPVRHSGVRTMLAFGGDVTAFNVVNYFARNVDQLLIGKLSGPGPLGLYSKGYQLLLLPLEQVLSPLAAVAVPMLSRLAWSPDRYRSAYIRTVEKVAMVTMPGVTFMMLSSDWMIRVILGEQWLGAALMFSFLSIAGLTQAVSGTSGWLFTTQGRTREMFHWGIVGGGLAVVSIVAGLPWGATGVAASYGVSGLLIRAPFLYWYVGRSGPVRTVDIYRTMIPAAVASVAVGIVLLIYRQFAAPASPRLALVVALGLALIATLPALWVVPAGRRLARDVRDLLPELLGGPGERIAS